MRLASSLSVLAVVVLGGCIEGRGSGLTGVTGGNGNGGGGSTSRVLTFFAPPAGGTTNQAMPVVEVVATDSLGSPDLAFARAVTVSLASNPTGAALSGTRTVAAFQGRATFVNLRIDRAGTYTMQATATDATPVTSAPFTVTAPIEP